MVILKTIFRHFVHVGNRSRPNGSGPHRHSVSSFFLLPLCRRLSVVSILIVLCLLNFLSCKALGACPLARRLFAYLNCVSNRASTHSLLASSIGCITHIGRVTNACHLFGHAHKRTRLSNRPRCACFLEVRRPLAERFFYFLRLGCGRI